MGIKVAGDISKYAARFLDTAIEAGDMTKDAIVESLVRTFKVGEKEARDAVEAKLGKPAAEAAPAPAPAPKPSSKVSKIKEQGPPPTAPIAATPPTEKPVPSPAARAVDESQFVSTTLPAKSMRPVADAYRKKYNMSEPSALVMNALENQILKDPDAIKAFQQYPGNATKILEAIEDRVDVKQIRRDVNQPPRATRQEKFEKPEPFTPPTIVSKAAVPDYESPVGPRPGVLASSAGTPPVREPPAGPKGLSTDARIAALRKAGMPLSSAESLLAQDLGPETAKSAVTSFKARAEKTSPDFSEMGYTPEVRYGGTLTAEEAAQLEAKGGFSKTATEGADYEGGLAGLGQRPEVETQGLGGRYEEPTPQPRTVEERLRNAEDSKIQPETREVAPAAAEAATSEAVQTKGQKSFFKKPYVLGGLGTAAAAGTTAAMMGREGKTPEGTGQTLEAKTPAQVPVGGGGTQPPEKKPSTTSVASQPETKKAKTLAGTIADARAGKGAGKASDDKVQKDTISTLDDVVKQVNEDQNFQYSPVRTDLISLRADAYKAYKEKANRNEWLDLAERALNAIGQFAAARSATGGFVAGFPQSKTDYAGRTEQAFREYQTELGTIGEQARAEERGAERLEAAKEREIARRQRTISERLADERAARAEAAAKERAIIAAGGKESLAAARKETQDVKDAYKRLGTQLSDTIREESILQKQIAAINKLGISKSSEDETKALAEIASLVPDLTVEQLKADIDKADDALTFRSTAKNQVASSLLGPMKEALQRLGARKEALYGARAGEQPVPETAPASTGQAAPASGKVITREELARYVKEQKMNPEKPEDIQSAKQFLISQGFRVQD